MTLQQYQTNKTPTLSNEVNLLQGHTNELFTVQFSTNGYFLSTAGFDRKILIWEVYGTKPKNISLLKGHSNSILDTKWSADSTKLFSCSADKSVIYWDLYKGEKVKTFKGHEGIVNEIAAGNDENTVFI